MAYTSSVGTSPTASPQEEAFWEGCPAQLLLIIASDFSIQSTLLRHADAIGAGRAQHDQGGKQEANGGKLAFIRAVQAFTCHGAAVPTSSLSQLTFTSHTGSLLLSLYAPRYCLTASAGFGRQFTKLRALSRLRRRYDSRKYRFPRSFCPFQPFPQRGGAGQAIAGVLGGAIRLGMMYRMGWLAAIVCQFRLPLR